GRVDQARLAVGEVSELHGDGAEGGLDADVVGSTGDARRDTGVGIQAEDVRTTNGAVLAGVRGHRDQDVELRADLPVEVEGSAGADPDQRLRARGAAAGAEVVAEAGRH